VLPKQERLYKIVSPVRISVKYYFQVVFLPKVSMLVHPVIGLTSTSFVLCNFTFMMGNLNPFHHREYQNDFPRYFVLIAVHSKCQPGKPSLHGEERIICCGSALQNLEVSFFCQFVRQDHGYWQACLQYFDRLTYRNDSSR
jgi:hypothetical protein